MDRNRLHLRFHHSGSTQSDESALDLERSCCYYSNLPSSCPSPQQPFASGAQHSESNAAYFSWPTSSRLNDAAEDRANYFGNLQKGVLPETLGQLPTGLQATSLLELMTIRAFHSKILRLVSLGTAIGFRIRKGVLTDIPAILVFVARKVHRQCLNHVQCLPAALEVASQETYGTLGAIVKSRTGNRQVGFLTNRHVAVDLDYPNQKMFHPLPPSLGPGVYLGAVERATSFITDDLWYGIFAGTNPETFVRADGAFIPFAEDFNMNNVTTSVKGVGEIGDINIIDLQSPINSLIGRQVVKVGRSSGLTTGTIMAYALEYNDEKGICFFTDFLVVGENQQTFDLEGDSGSLILLTGQNGEKPRAVGIIWGGTANRGRLKLKVGQSPENWTSGVDLGRLLDLLELDLIITSEGLQAALQEQRNASAAGIGSTVAESSPASRMPSKDKHEENFEPLGFHHIPVQGESYPERNAPSIHIHTEFHIENEIETVPNVEHQFIPSFAARSPVQINQNNHLECKNLSALRNGSDEEICVSLQLGDQPESKRRKHSNCSFNIEEP
ncbi:protein NARROW LEAF 1 isoform X3 [Juglans microcarpa x Juglans regia]|uniref:protein NARROW LEAF 1 isoform X3 n=1 Tax=Juglans microcarpa x Juglans regia TaxID=2249226 RepID=UPI001B7DE726|nr:protein NARROW LEAF 1 isoform X3 [Juglans microcarpa x Juglans regia]